MKKLFVLLLASLFIFAACSNGNSKPKDPEQTPASTTTLYSVTIDNGIINGTVTASKTSDIAEGETITLTVTPDNGFVLDTLTVKKGEDDVSITTNNTFIMPAGSVNVYALFKVKPPIGTKAADEPKEVGDIVFNDGSATPYTAQLTLTDEQKAAAIAIIFYKGTGLNTNGDACRTLGVGLKQGEGAWCTTDALAYNLKITTIQCKAYENTETGDFTFSGDKNGSDNCLKLRYFLIDNCNNMWDISSSRYPAIHFADFYMDTAKNLGTKYLSGWYLPSVAELYQIYENGIRLSRVFDLNAAIELCGGDKFGIRIRYYWSFSQDGSSNNQAMICSVESGVCDSAEKEINLAACAIREFN